MIAALARALERPLAVRDAYVPLEAIVVLGAPLRHDATLSPILAERVAAGAALFHRGAGRWIVVTGGATGRASTEAAAMAEALRRAGVPESAIVVEDVSRNTAENAALAAPLLRALGVRSVWIVTQAFHGRRAARLFRARGFEVRVWHIEGSLLDRDPHRAVRLIIREYAAWAALVYGVVVGGITRVSSTGVRFAAPTCVRKRSATRP